MNLYNYKRIYFTWIVQIVHALDVELSSTKKTVHHILINIQDKQDIKQGLDNKTDKEL